MSNVLDASAALAVLNKEPGAEKVVPLLSDAVMSLVNAIEVGGKLMDGGMAYEAAWEAIDLLDVPLIELDLELARSATALREPTQSIGLSLADRVCLALAIRENATAVTADRIWSKLDLGCKIELVR